MNLYDNFRMDDRLGDYSEVAGHSQD